MQDLFIYHQFQSPEHTELAEYIVDRSKELFFEGGVNNIFSPNAEEKSIEFFNNLKKPVRIITAHYEKSDARVSTINTLFLRVSLNYYYNVFFTFATSTLSTKDFVSSAQSIGLQQLIDNASTILEQLNDFAFTPAGQTFLAETNERRAQCIFNLKSISLGIDTPKRFAPAIGKSDAKKKEGCYIATMVYGSYDAPEVLLLRKHRDEVLMRASLGILFVKIYYTLSPFLVRQLGDYRVFHLFSKKIIDIYLSRTVKENILK